jgi:hypothetical protein
MKAERSGTSPLKMGHIFQTETGPWRLYCPSASSMKKSGIAPKINISVYGTKNAPVGYKEQFYLQADALLIRGLTLHYAKWQHFSSPLSVAFLTTITVKHSIVLSLAR